MSLSPLVNDVTVGLEPYPMEELARIRKELEKQGKKVFDFGTGDPTLPTPSFVRDSLAASIPTVSQYPTIGGLDTLREAHESYLSRRLGMTSSDEWMVIPSRGSKEAIFHIALSLVGRSGGKKLIIYPTPGYPVYKTSIQFAGGIPYPVKLEQSRGYLLEPWLLPEEVQKTAAAIWLNYPHNPTGACAPHSYWHQVISWCHERDCILLSDDCYLDIYDPAFDSSEHSASLVPASPLAWSTDRVLGFFSLSKRTGMTGYRVGMIAGDSRILKPHLRARANFGLGTPEFIQKAAALAWKDDAHVVERRHIFDQRLELAAPAMIRLGLVDEKPRATFYLWCRVPAHYGDDDIRFCLDLAKEGMITSPSQWLGEGVKGYFRLAMVPNDDETREALRLFETFVTKT